MNWILIAIAAGMLSTSSHDTEEACLGREAMYKKEHKSAQTKCVDMRVGVTTFTGSPGSIRLCGLNGTCQ